MAALRGSMNRELIAIMGRSSLLRGYNSVVINPKRFVRALRRKPVAVLYPDGKRETPIKSNLTAGQTKQLDTPKQGLENGARRRTKEKSSTVQCAKKSSGDQGGFPEQSPGVTSQLGGLRFDKVPPGDKRLAKVASIARSRAFREQQNKVLLEGRRLICDALAAGATPQMLFFSRVEKLCQLPLHELRHASLLKVKFGDIKIWSDLVTPQGVIAIFSKPDASRLRFPTAMRRQSVPLSLICDNVRDEGTLGTLLRSAAAAGCDRALLTTGCVDAWGPKVLRAAMGAHFRLPVITGLDWDDVTECFTNPLTIHVVDNGGYVPKVGDADWGCSDSEEHWEERSESDNDELPLPQLERKVYHENWAQKSTALVVPGDAYGLSLEALQLASESGGHKLHIPTAPGVGGLSVAMAASILLFEGRRQLLELSQKASRSTAAVTR